MLYLQSLKLARKNLRAVIKTFYAAMMVEREIAALVILLIPCVLFDSTCAQDRFLRGEALKLDIDDKFTVTQNEAHEEALRSVEETLKRGPTAAPNTIPFVPCSKITFLTEGSYAYFSNPGYPNGPKPNTRCNWRVLVPGYSFVYLVMPNFEVPCSRGHHLQFYIGGVWNNLCTPNINSGNDTSTGPRPFQNGLFMLTNTEAGSKELFIRYWVQATADRAAGFVLAMATFSTSTRPAEPAPQCGTRGTTRIIDGTVAEPNSYPWQVFLNVYSGQALIGRSTCGSTLINERWLMTAAHCTSEAWLVIAFLGCSSVINSRYNCDQIQTIMGGNNILNHPDYVQTRIGDGFDVSLLRLPIKAILNRKVRLICLPSLPAPTQGDEMLVAGWGLTEEGTSSTDLKEATMVTMTDGECSRGLKPLFPAGITDRVLCTSPGSGQVFFGDSGGFGGNEVDGRFEQWGIVSFGTRRINRGIPVVFTEVSHYLTWIYKTMFLNVT